MRWEQPVAGLIGVRVLCAGHFSEQIRGRICIRPFQPFLMCISPVLFLYCTGRPEIWLELGSSGQGSKERIKQGGGKEQVRHRVQIHRGNEDWQWDKAEAQPLWVLLTDDADYWTTSEKAQVTANNQEHVGSSCNLRVPLWASCKVRGGQIKEVGQQSFPRL